MEPRWLCQWCRRPNMTMCLHHLWLIRAGLNPNCPGDAQAAERLLHAALQQGREPLLHRLLGLQAEEQRKPAHCTQQALDVAALAERLQANPLLHAVRRSSLEGLRCLLVAGCPPGAVPAGSGLPPLVAAASRLDTARVQLLLRSKAPAGETDQRGQSALDAVLALCTDPTLVSWAGGVPSAGKACMGMWHKRLLVYN